MLEKIKIKNFATYTKETTVDFKATDYKLLEDENVISSKILKGVLFVGDNASGKTNMINAINFLLEILFNYHNFFFDDLINLYVKEKNGMCKMEYYFNVDGSSIVYIIEFNQVCFTTEKLILNKKEVIDRSYRNAICKISGTDIIKDILRPCSVINWLYSENKLYGNKVLIKWFETLKNSIYINFYDIKNIMIYSDYILSKYDYLEKYGVDEFNKVFEYVTGNETAKYEDRTITRNMIDFYESEHRYLSFNKNGSKKFVSEVYKSTGESILSELIPLFIQAINNDSLLIIDNYGLGLDNGVEERLLKYFFRHSNNSQIFLASHSTNLLNNTLLRPDQIYSICFDSKKGSILKRFSDEKPRESQNIENMYLNGTFDALPRYTNKNDV